MQQRQSVGKQSEASSARDLYNAVSTYLANLFAKSKEMGYGFDLMAYFGLAGPGLSTSSLQLRCFASIETALVTGASESE
jgi:hypothetical protein